MQISRPSESAKKIWRKTIKEASNYNYVTFLFFISAGLVGTLVVSRIALQNIQPRTWLLLQENLSGIKIRAWNSTATTRNLLAPKSSHYLRTDKAPSICLMCVSFDTGINWLYVITIYYSWISMMGMGLFICYIYIYIYIYIIFILCIYSYI